MREIKLKNGNTLEIHQDSHGQSPREWDNICDMICFHNRYNLGDSHDINHGDYNSWQDMRDSCFDEDAIIVPLYLYDHSGITIATSPFSCRWDSGQVGFAVITKHTIKKEYGYVNPKTRALALKCLESEIKTYDQYLRGEVYGYILKDSDGVEIDSCWGFYGYDLSTNGIYDSINITEKEMA